MNERVQHMTFGTGMRAVTRVAMRVFGKSAVAAALALVPAMAAAQQTQPATSNSAAPDIVGPRELQNFKLPGTVTRQADQPATTAAPPPRRAPATQAPSPSAPEPATLTRTRTAAPPAARPPERSTAPAAKPPQPQASVAPPQTIAPPAPDTSATPAAPQSFPPPADVTPAAPRGPAVPLYLWLVAALLLGAGAAFLFRRNRSREAFAGAPEAGSFAAPEIEAPVAPRAPVEPEPAPSPPPAPAAPPVPAGIVSTRLRPWVEVGFVPVRCVLEADHATIEFAVELFNSGSRPARNILVDATAFNAGPTQDAQINTFFANPREQGQQVDVIPPLERVTFELQLSIPREQLQLYELGGQQVFVPIVAFNTLYRWGGGDGQTSASYLVGRGTQTDKLGPFRADAGPRIFRGLDARTLPPAVRR